MLLTLLLLSAQNLVVNGDFESNSSSGCDYNNANGTFNSKMTGCTAYGPSDEIDIMDSGGCYGPAGPVGSTKVAIACNGDPINDAFTMSLTGALTAGNSYTLKVHLYAHIESWSPGQLPVEFGLTTAAGTQGSVVATLTPTTGSFTQLPATFVAPNAATHLSLTAKASSVDGWTHVDGVELTGGFTLSKSGTCPGTMTLSTSGAPGGSNVAIIYGNPGTKTKPSGVCAGTTVAIANPKKLVILSSNGSGNASVTFPASGFCGKTMQAVVVGAGPCTTSNTLVL